jgi:hypothetical protein
MAVRERQYGMRCRAVIKSVITGVWLRDSDIHAALMALSNFREDSRSSERKITSKLSVAITTIALWKKLAY